MPDVFRAHRRALPFTRGQLYREIADGRAFYVVGFNGMPCALCSKPCEQSVERAATENVNALHPGPYYLLQTLQR